MNYDQFIELYPAVDLALEIFKGLAPTIVAVLAIIINNSLAKARNQKDNELLRKKKIADAKIVVLNTMLEKYIEFSQLIWASGTKLILYLSEENGEKREKLEREFQQSIYEFQFKSQDIFAYYKAMFEQYDFNINSGIALEDANKFAIKLITICEKNNQVYKIKCASERNLKLDKVADEIKEETLETCAWTNSVMQSISKKIKAIYEEG